MTIIQCNLHFKLWFKQTVLKRLQNRIFFKQNKKSANHKNANSIKVHVDVNITLMCGIITNHSGQKPRRYQNSKKHFSYIYTYIHIQFGSKETCSVEFALASARICECVSVHLLIDRNFAREISVEFTRCIFHANALNEYDWASPTHVQ